MKIKCIIVEDEPKAFKLMEEYVMKTPFLELLASFYNSLDAMHFMNDKKVVDLIFLDINLPDISGMEMASLIHPSIKIIFTTAYSDYAIKSYEVNTIDYLLKPIVYSRFLQAVSKARNLLEKEQPAEIKTDSSVFLKSGKKMVQLNWEDIFYVEASKEYLSVVTSSQKILIYKRMVEFEMMQPKNFQRVHNSYIINLDKIDKVEDNLVFIKQQEIPIGKTYKDAFYSVIRNRLF